MHLKAELERVERIVNILRSLVVQELGVGLASLFAFAVWTSTRPTIASRKWRAAKKRNQNSATTIGLTHRRKTTLFDYPRCRGRWLSSYRDHGVLVMIGVIDTARF